MTRSFIAPNSSIASFFRNLPETLQEPAALAMMGSLGAHVLFFATLPAFTSPEPANPDRQLRRVQVINLPQQGQAAQSSSVASQLRLPAVPKPTNQKVPVPSNSPSSTLISPNPLLYGIPGLSNPTSPVPVPPQEDYAELLRQWTARQRALARAQSEPTRRQPVNPPEKPQPSPSPSYTTSPSGTLAPFDPRTLDTTPTPPGTPTASPQPQASNSPAPTTTPSPQDPKAAQQIALQNQYLTASQYSANGTDLKGYGDRLNQWLGSDAEAFRQNEYAVVQFPTENNQPAIELTSKLPFAIQNFRSNEALIAVKVGTDGKLIGEPQLLMKTGYPNSLDREAVEYAKQEVAKLPAPQKKTIYFYRVKFKPPTAQPTAQNRA